MDIIKQILLSNKYWFITVAEILGYVLLFSFIIFHLIIYLGRRNFKEGKYHLYFSIFFTGLLGYIFTDSSTFHTIVPKIFDFNPWYVFIIALCFLIIIKGIILILNASFDFAVETRKTVNRVFNYYSIFNLVWLARLIVKTDIFYYSFWVINLLFIIGLSVFYFRYFYKNYHQIESSVKIITCSILGYILLVSIYRILWIIFPAVNSYPLWMVHDVCKLSVIFIFAYALAKKTNKEFIDLQELKNSLELKVIEKTRELREAKERIEENNEQRTNYFINLAHETKTPLTLISNYLDRYIKTNGSSKELFVVKENFEKLKIEMIRLLDVEKYEKGLVSFEDRQIINLSESINAKAPLFKEHALASKMNLSIEIEDNINIQGDQSAINSIVNNLFENAVKFSDEGSSIKIQLSKKGSLAYLIVSDTGCGIEEEKLKHIFQPYYQVSRTKLNRQGLGMGLFIVKSIVDLMKGKIEVKSTVNEGTKIAILLPLEAASSVESIVNPDINQLTVTKNNCKPHNYTYSVERNSILIVEDNADMLHYLADELNEEYNVFTAINGLEALTLLKTSPKVDVILSDVMMDQMDGYSFYEAISKNGNYATIPFIILTARSNDNEKIEMLTKGVTDYLYKPFSIDELKAKIQSVLINTKNQRTSVLKETLNVIQNQIISGNENVNDKWTNFEFIKRENNLTDRQVEIIKLVEQGLEYKQISDKLNISVKTTHRHIQNLFEKFGVHSKMELMKALFN
jgi:signal transduction histidine kinase/DNA-binding NarL/FixJ family response regulator